MHLPQLPLAAWLGSMHRATPVEGVEEGRGGGRDGGMGYGCLGKPVKMIGESGGREGEGRGEAWWVRTRRADRAVDAEGGRWDERC